MKKLILAYWLVPFYVTFLVIYESLTLFSILSVYQNGESLAAKVEYLKIKNMQAQSNGVMDIQFTDNSGKIITKNLTLPVQLAAQLQEMAIIPIRYQETAFIPVVFVPTFEFQKNMVMMNLGILVFSLVSLLWAGIRINRFIFKKNNQEKMNEQVTQAWNAIQKQEN